MSGRQKLSYRPPLETSIKKKKRRLDSPEGPRSDSGLSAREHRTEQPALKGNMVLVVSKVNADEKPPLAGKTTDVSNKLSGETALSPRGGHEEKLLWERASSSQPLSRSPNAVTGQSSNSNMSPAVWEVKVRLCLT